MGQLDRSLGDYARIRREMGGGPIDFDRALNRFKRPQYGYDPSLRRDTLAGFSSNAYNAGTGYANQAKQFLGSRGLGRSAAGLGAFRRGAQIQGETYQNAALPFAREEAQFGEGQRQFDIGAGIDWASLLNSRDINIRNLALQMLQAGKKEGTFGIDTPFGGISF